MTIAFVESSSIEYCIEAKIRKFIKKYFMGRLGCQYLFICVFIFSSCGHLSNTTIEKAKDTLDAEILRTRIDFARNFKGDTVSVYIDDHLVVDNEILITPQYVDVTNLFVCVWRTKFASAGEYQYSSSLDTTKSQFICKALDRTGMLPVTVVLNKHKNDFLIDLYTAENIIFSRYPLENGKVSIATLPYLMKYN